MVVSPPAHPHASSQVVTWICDPMHGNTECVNNYKTRRYENIRAEVEAFFDVHDECGERYPAHYLAETPSADRCPRPCFRLRKDLPAACLCRGTFVP